MKKRFILVVGGGKFGKKAVEYGLKHNYSIIVIDNRHNCIVNSSADKIFNNYDEFLKKINNLTENKVFLLISDVSITYKLIKDFLPGLIIPVVPIHLMANIIIQFLRENSINLKASPSQTLEFIKNSNPDLILGYNPNKGTIYLSYAKENEICPDNCTGPPDYCPNFKREKPITITDFVRNQFSMSKLYKFDVNNNKIIISIESSQLTSGLGGLKGTDVESIINNLKKDLSLFQYGIKLAIATTCNCHGVINFYEKEA
ncbi:MAG: hypothetical protein ACP6IY_14960 [Promethearchaeia archaeon]